MPVGIVSNMAKRLLIVALFVVALVIATVMFWRPAPPVPEAGPNSRPRVPLPDAPALSTPAPGGIAVVIPSPANAGMAQPTAGVSPTPPRATSSAEPVSAAAAAPSTSSSINTQTAMIDLDKTQRMIRDYHTRMGENPVGTNAEIMKAIMGGNPRQAVVGPGEGQRLNANGELVDPWGTPYFFHQLSGSHMEIHSAGPDKIMGTDDDLVLK